MLSHDSQTLFLGYITRPEWLSVDEGKVTTVTTWPTPSSVKELQRYLGFENFYRKVIRGFSSIATPLTALLRKSPKKLTLNHAMEEAFSSLKTAFITLLQLPS